MRYVLILAITLIACGKQANKPLQKEKTKEVVKTIIKPQIDPGSCYITEGVHKSTGLRIVQFRSYNGEILSIMSKTDATPEAIDSELYELSELNICKR